MIELIRGDVYAGQLRVVSGKYTLSLMGLEYGTPLREVPVGEKFLIEKIDHRLPFAVATVVTAQGERGRVYNSELNAYSKVI